MFKPESFIKKIVQLKEQGQAKLVLISVFVLNSGQDQKQ